MSEMADVGRWGVMKLWRINVEPAGVVLVECPRGRYPSKDADGHTVYDNTHFSTAAEAWDKVIAETSAGCSLAARDVERARAGLRRAEAGAADALVAWRRAIDARHAWEQFAPQAPAAQPKPPEDPERTATNA